MFALLVSKYSNTSLHVPFKAVLISQSLSKIQVLRPNLICTSAEKLLFISDPQSGNSSFFSFSIKENPEQEFLKKKGLVPAENQV
jgi:hypothetical protein